MARLQKENDELRSSAFVLYIFSYTPADVLFSRSFIVGGVVFVLMRHPRSFLGFSLRGTPVDDVSPLLFQECMLVLNINSVGTVCSTFILP